jgi:hypothetical protein
MDCCNFRIAVKNLERVLDLDHASGVSVCVRKQITLYGFNTSQRALDALKTLRDMGHQANLVDPYAVFVEYVDLKDPYEMCAYFSTFGKICAMFLHETHAFVVFCNKKAAVDVLEWGPTHWIRDTIYIKVRPKKLAECDPFVPKPYSPVRSKIFKHVTTTTYVV